MRATKKIVHAMMMKHASDGTREWQTGDLMDFSCLAGEAINAGLGRLDPNAQSDLEERARRNARQWGWIDAYGRAL